MVETLSDTYWARAEENLEAARRDFGAGGFNASANRAYYAVFHAATSLLLRFGIETRTHAGARGMFGKEVLHRRKLLPERFGEIYSRLYEFRELADYPKRAVSISRKEAESALRDAETFVAGVGRVRGVV